jgi:hypothetical protein
MCAHRIEEASMSGVRVFVIGIAVVLTCAAAHAQQYYRWSTAPGFTCTATGGHVDVLFASQPVEWDLAPGAEFNIVYVSNGVPTPTGPFPLPSGTGSQVYAGLLVSAPSYPATVTVRLETLINGVPLYLSSMTATCSGDSSGTSTIDNVSLQTVPTLSGAGVGLLALLVALAGVAVLSAFPRH